MPSTDGFGDVGARRLLEVLGFLVLVVVVGLFLTAAVPQLLGADHSFVVQSPSMAPAIPAGSMVYVSEVPAEDVAVDDVITFQRTAGSETRVTHRVVEVVERDGRPAFRTMGDANTVADQDLVTPDRVVGVVQFHLPVLGRAITTIQSPLGIVALIVLPAIALFVLEARDLFSQPSDSPDRPADESRQKDETDDS